MRATDLIGCPVYDSNGEHLGTVHDLCFQTRGDTEKGTWGCRLVRIACGTVSIAHHLGYGAGDMAGPWPLTSLFGWLRGRSLEIEWADVKEFRADRIDVGKTRQQLRSKDRRS